MKNVTNKLCYESLLKTIASQVENNTFFVCFAVVMVLKNMSLVFGNSGKPKAGNSLYLTLSNHQLNLPKIKNTVLYRRSLFNGCSNSIFAETLARSCVPENTHNQIQQNSFRSYISELIASFDLQKGNASFL